MKFGQDFQASLNREEFPPEWVDSAISYKKLKKCIKRVQKELLSLGLDQETLDALWQHVSRSTTDSTQHELSERFLHYSVNGDKVNFTPKLTIALDPQDGSPMDAWLSPDTRRYLRRLARSPRVPGGIPTNSSSPSPESKTRKVSVANIDEVTSGNNGVNGDVDDAQEIDELETIEIPLNSDSEFFQILRTELRTLDKLQHKEQDNIQNDVHDLGQKLSIMKASNKRRSKEELQAWRRVFDLYIDAQVFLSSHEQDAGVRDVSHAQKQLQYFTKTMSEQQRKERIRSKEATAALDRFVQINMDLLRLLKFQEINETALTKIMKKFDKQTALHASAAIPDSLRRGTSTSQDLAKATCFTISQELLELLPHLNDYVCPVCLGISYKPVRLSCKHLFCIRCLIVMQREKQNSCPLCRAEVVLAANSDNIDEKLKKFLENNFKSEVKEKQKANELAVAIDRFGEAYQPSKCIVM